MRLKHMSIAISTSHRVMLRNNSLMQYANYLIILSVCIDQGDGRWKERDKETFQRDIVVYGKIAEKLEREMEAFYEEYPDAWLSGNIDNIDYKYLTNLLKHNTDTTKESENKNKDKHNFSIATARTNIYEAGSEKGANTRKETKFGMLEKSYHLTKESKSSRESSTDSDWPKFDEILLAIGRKYDWKNDRWIKVREKPSKVMNNVIITKGHKVDLHEKHKFNYRIVKLNRSKSRRNIVVAVSAVR